MPTCIYCRAAKEIGEFNREHVIPDGFGRFQGALTLHGQVCQACNQVFGDTIDRELQRAGLEGFERYRWGVKSPEEIQKFRYDHLTLRAKDVGDFADARFQILPGPRGLMAKLVPTVAMRNAHDDGYTEFTEQEIAAEAWHNRAVDWRRGVRILGDEQSVARLTALLTSQGVTPTIVRPLSLPPGESRELTFTQAVRFTEGMRRAIAKIAFNYLAQREGAGFVLAEQFDPIRNFIRWGAVPALEPIFTEDRQPFGVSDPDRGRPVVHFVGIAPPHPAHRNLLGLVSLFGALTHTVMLAEEYQGPAPTPHAHLYNVKTRTVHPWRPGEPFDPGCRA